jgi:hypothetical protein
MGRRTRLSAGQNGDQELISISLQPGVDKMDLRSNQKVNCSAFIMCPQIPKHNQYRAGFDVILVIDNSYSMEAEIEPVRKSALSIVEKSEEIDRICLIVFSDKAKVCCPLTQMSQEGKEEMRNAIISIVLGSTTDIESGLKEAFQMVADNRSARSALILLLSDGYDSNPSTINERIKHQTEYFSKRIQTHYTIHTYGYGANHGANAMRLIADENNGHYSYIKDIETLPNIFDHEFEGMSNEIARDIKIELKMLPCGVEFFISEVSPSSENLIIKYHSLSYGDCKVSNFVLTFTGCERPPLGTIRPIKAKLSYTDNEGRRQSKSSTLKILIVEPDNMDNVHKNSQVVAAFLLGRVAITFDKMIDHQENGRIRRAEKRGNRTINRINNSDVSQQAVMQRAVEDINDAVVNIQANDIQPKLLAYSVKYNNQIDLGLQNLIDDPDLKGSSKRGRKKKSTISIPSMEFGNCTFHTRRLIINIYTTENSDSD